MQSERQRPKHGPGYTEHCDTQSFSNVITCRQQGDSGIALIASESITRHRLTLHSAAPTAPLYKIRPLHARCGDRSTPHQHTWLC